MGRILVTGASGNVGKYVADFAIKNGSQITVAGQNTDKLQEIFHDNAKIVHFDFSDSTTFEQVLEDVETVFIMRPPQMGNPADLYPFIDAIRDKNDIKLISFLSLIGIEHNPVPPHYKIEKYIEKSGVPFCHIRPSFFMQNISGIHAFEIKNFNKIVVPVKKAKTSFIDVSDIGELIAHVLSNPLKHQNTAYSVTGPEAIDYFEVAKILSDKLQRSISYANPNPHFTKKYWINIRGLDKEYANVMNMLYFMTRMGTAKKTTDTFEQVMGKKPRLFSEFADDNLSSWK